MEISVCLSTSKDANQGGPQRSPTALRGVYRKTMTNGKHHTKRGPRGGTGSSAPTSKRPRGKDSDQPLQNPGMRPIAQSVNRGPGLPGPGPLPHRTAIPAGTILLYGTHAVTAAWVNPRRRIRALFAAADAWSRLAAGTPPAGVARPEPVRLGGPALADLVGPGAVHQGLIAAVEPLPAMTLDDLLPTPPTSGDPGFRLLLALDQVTDPQNVGAILRSAAAFGAAAVIVQDRHSPPETGALAKAASGALETVPLVRVTNLARALRQCADSGFWSVGLDGTATNTLAEILDRSGRDARRIIVLGSEGGGLRRLVAETCDARARLPMPGAMESLNVSVAAAVALYEATR